MTIRKCQIKRKVFKKAFSFFWHFLICQFLVQFFLFVCFVLFFVFILIYFLVFVFVVVIFVVFFKKAQSITRSW